MINIINTASDTMINATTVSDIGICYYDFSTETLKELSSLTINACSVVPLARVIKKYYLLYIILYLKKILLHLDLRSGVLYINIHMQRVYLRKEVVNYLLQLKMMQKIDFLLFKLNVK